MGSLDSHGSEVPVCDALVGTASAAAAAVEDTKLNLVKQRAKLLHLGALDLVQAETTHVSRLRCLLESFRDPIQSQKILTREEVKVFFHRYLYSVGMSLSPGRRCSGDFWRG
jgi:hypothetical protein